MKRFLTFLTLAGLLLGCATSTQKNVTGKSRSQLLIVPASQVQTMSLQYYQQEKSEASNKGRLITSGPKYDRVARVLHRMIPQVAVFRQDAAAWQWELALIDDPTINAHVLAGGKVTFYTGLIDTLKLTDDEIAAVMGHEMSHALREHTREKMSQDAVGQLALNVGGVALGLGEGAMQLAGLAKQLGLDLPFSRGMESEADVYGLELAARSGYDPRAAISLWDKMDAQGGGAPPQFLSTHPAPKNRKAELEKLMPKVMPLYRAAGGQG
ncbi:MAG: M48 family metallopeptidase [Gallionellaceae bacterium]|nr:M48 family metallopeptidase [Gallionellaceae bacterium]